MQRKRKDDEAITVSLSYLKLLWKQIDELRAVVGGPPKPYTWRTC